ncbi:MAG: tetratricopeptide repeat protein, partial [Calothrix sp. CSU_2_0]|nr:tetratricopeptide repeat protein [Calothrix sp. CSU_2_0]
GRYEEAIASCEEALKIKPDYHEALCGKGIALANLGQFSEAIASYEEVLKFKPDDDAAWYNRACTYGVLGNIDTAIENLQTAINLNPECREMAKTDTDFDAIRDDGRFQALINQQ